jgi:hypothetical protein
MNQGPSLWWSTKVRGKAAAFGHLFPLKLKIPFAAISQFKTAPGSVCSPIDVPEGLDVRLVSGKK